MPRFVSCGAVLPLSDLVYLVRAECRSGPGRRFFSSAIAMAWAREEEARTGTPHAVHEVIARDT